MALLQSDVSDVSKSKKTGMRMEKCLFGQQELDVPEIMMEDVRFYYSSDILCCHFRFRSLIISQALILMNIACI